MGAVQSEVVMKLTNLVLLAPLTLLIQGCWFVYIPGSVTGAISDSITGAEGAHCVRANAKLGDPIRLPGGGQGTIKSLSGTSMRCTNPEYPIRALLVLSDDKPTTPTPTSARPPWLKEQRILDESILGQRIKKELQAYVAERQKQIDAKEVELKSLQKLVDSPTHSPEEEENLKKETLLYTALIRRLNGEVQARKTLVLGQFQATIDEALAQVSKHGFEEEDPNEVLIQFLDQHPELGRK